MDDSKHVGVKTGVIAPVDVKTGKSGDWSYCQTLGDDSDEQLTIRLPRYRGHRTRETGIETCVEAAVRVQPRDEGSGLPVDPREGTGHNDFAIRLGHDRFDCFNEQNSRYWASRFKY